MSFSLILTEKLSTEQKEKTKQNAA